LGSAKRASHKEELLNFIIIGRISFFKLSNFVDCMKPFGFVWRTRGLGGMMFAKKIG
jgi:hypothetical protein